MDRFKVAPAEPSTKTDTPTTQSRNPRDEAVAERSQERFEKLVRNPAPKKGKPKETMARSDAGESSLLQTLDAHEAAGAVSSQSGGEGSMGHETAADDSNPFGFQTDDASLVASLDENSNLSSSISPAALFSRGARIAAAAHPVRTSPDRIVALAQQVSERILVSDAASHQQEVRIQVRESILPGTEIRVSQQLGQLQVHVFTDQQRSLDFLHSQQAALAVQLEQRLARNVVVEIEFDSKGHSFHHDQPSGDQQRSGGGQDERGTEDDEPAPRKQKA